MREKAHKGMLEVNRFGNLSDRKKNQFCLHAAHIGLKYISDFAYVLDYLAENEALHLIIISKLMDKCYRLSTLKCKYNHNNDTDMGVIKR